MRDFDLLILLTLLFCCLTVAILSFLSPLLRPRVKLDRLAQVRLPETDEEEQESWRGIFRRLAKSLGERLKRPEDQLSTTRQRLLEAGIRSQDAPSVVMGARMLLAFGAMLGTSVLLAPWGINFLLPSVFAGLLGLVVPGLVLRSLSSNRKLRIVWSLPDFMDLLLVCSEAGLGLDQAMDRVGKSLRETHRDLSDELRLYKLQVNAGSGRAQSLRALASRTGIEELRSFAAVLIQADKFGTSVSRTLRVYSEDLRVRRRQAAEEAAAKLTVKLMIPLILFIFPAILVVTAGPAVIAIIRALFGALTRSG